MSPQTIAALGVFVGLLALTWVVRGFLFARLTRLAERSTNPFDDILVAATRGPFLVWGALFATSVATRMAHVPDRYVGFSDKILLAMVVLSLAWALSGLLTGLVRTYTETIHSGFATPTLTQNVVRILVLGVAGLMLLDIWGISIAPLLTALGVGSLAVALALQETLANFFSGMYLLASHHFHVGDYLKLESGQEGYILDIGWRATRLRTIANNVVIIPNAKLAQSIVTNHHHPEPRLVLPIRIGVGYGSDPDQVTKALLEETIRAAETVPGLLMHPAPSVSLLPGFGESSLDFTLVCHVREFADQAPVQDELHRRILARFRRDGIEIPYPTRTVEMKTT